MSYFERKLPRRTGYDYAREGYYFVTICTYDRQHLFGDGINLTDIGRTVENELNCIPEHFSAVYVNKYAIMPNHIHCIIVIGRGNTNGTSISRPTLSTIIGLFKSGVTRIVRTKYSYTNIWQKSFHDRIIRNDDEYSHIWSYIDENPARWNEDEYYAANQ